MPPCATLTAVFDDGVACSVTGWSFGGIGIAPLGVVVPTAVPLASASLPTSALVVGSGCLAVVSLPSGAFVAMAEPSVVVLAEPSLTELGGIVGPSIPPRAPVALPPRVP